ncbi:MAG: hypothetical protein FJW40_27140 [Acidobacteria bacterium]|nr:hypothetical protein [Acidobacteriota bacterium]
MANYAQHFRAAAVDGGSTAEQGAQVGEQELTLAACGVVAGLLKRIEGAFKVVLNGVELVVGEHQWPPRAWRRSAASTASRSRMRRRAFGSLMEGTTPFLMSDLQVRAE